MWVKEIIWKLKPLTTKADYCIVKLCRRLCCDIKSITGNRYMLLLGKGLLPHMIALIHPMAGLLSLKKPKGLKKLTLITITKATPGEKRINFKNCFDILLLLSINLQSIYFCKVTKAVLIRISAGIYKEIISPKKMKAVQKTGRLYTFLICKKEQVF